MTRGALRSTPGAMLGRGARRPRQRHAPARHPPPAPGPPGRPRAPRPPRPRRWCGARPHERTRRRPTGRTRDGGPAGAAAPCAHPAPHREPCLSMPEISPSVTAPGSPVPARIPAGPARALACGLRMRTRSSERQLPTVLIASCAVRAAGRPGCADRQATAAGLGPAHGPALLARTGAGRGCHTSVPRQDDPLSTHPLKLSAYTITSMRLGWHPVNEPAWAAAT